MSRNVCLFCEHSFPSPPVQLAVKDNIYSQLSDIHSLARPVLYR